jgi:hypothetical protein
MEDRGMSATHPRSGTARAHDNGGGGPGRVKMEWEDEGTWLRARIIRLRTILRYA